MKTLVIHTKDDTTDFLKEIYFDKDWTIIDFNPSNSFLKKQIKEHDRIIMLGHGDENGLFGHKRKLITSQHVYLLRNKECVSIWCHADKFVNKHDIKGFYTGMFISEMDEAYYEGVYGVTYDEIDLSNKTFAKSVGKNIDSSDFLNQVKSDYENHDNAVILYNYRLLGYKK